MSSFAWMIVIVLALTVLGSAALMIVTVKFYWGVRGAPPLTGEARRLQKQEELRQRAKQIELTRQNPRTTRSDSFLDNRKISSK